MAKARFRTFEVRAAEDGSEGVVEGLVTKFGTEYPIGFGLRESIEPGAFDGSLESSGGVIPIYAQHDHKHGGTPIGVGTVTRSDDGYKVRAELFIDDDPKARSVYRAMKARALREWSVGFVTPNESDVVRVRDLEKIVRGDLMEASVVLRGANPDTETLAVRSEDEDRSASEERIDERQVPAEWLDRLGDPHVRELFRTEFVAASE